MNPVMAKVVSLQLHEGHGTPMRAVAEAHARVGGGIEGDSHVHRARRAVTVVDLSTHDSVGVKPGDLREQITVEGLPTLGDLAEGTLLRLGATFACEYEEQEELNQYCVTLGQLALRALAEKQPFVSEEAIKALAELQADFTARRTQMPGEWWKIRSDGPATVPYYWPDALAASLIGDVMIAAVDDHFYFVGDAARA